MSRLGLCLTSISMGAIATVMGCGLGAQDPPRAAEHAVMIDRSQQAVTSLPRLQYYGGKLITSPHIIEILYGTGSYLAELTSTSAPNMPSFYRQVTSSGVFDWIKEYNTSSPNPIYAIGRGAFRGSVQITPSASRNGSTITDAQVQAELSAQIAGGALPAPNDKLFYMVHFPVGKTLVHVDGSKSCVTGGFCAYHGTYLQGSQDVFYAVLPDLTTGGCATGCGGSNAFSNQMSVASHELIEAVTDPEIGLTDLTASPYEPSYPDAWFDPDHAESGDICVTSDTSDQVPFSGTDGFTYVAQKEWSNHDSACILTRTTPPDESDILWRTTDGTMLLWPISGGARQDQLSPGAPDTGWTIQGAGDFDGNGRSDLYWRCTAPSCFQTTHGQLAIWYDAQHSNPPPSYPGLVGDDGWQIKGVGDFDGNGKSDILWQYSGPVNHGQLAIWWNGQYNSPPPFYPTPAVGDDGWQIQGIGDFDADGRSDILWRYFGSVNHGQLAIWFSGQYFTPPPFYPTPAVTDDGWRIRGIGDFDGDGKSDILWQYTGQVNHGQLAVWWSGQYVNPPAWYPALVGDDSQVILGIGDFNGDSKSDVLWRNTGPVNHGRLDIWFGAQNVNPAPVSPGTVSDATVFQTTGSFN